MEHVAVARTTFTGDPNPASKTSAGEQAIHQTLVPLSAAYFMGAFVTDLAYWQTANVMWERFSVWLITAGLLIAAIAVIAALIDLASGGQKPAWPRALAYALTLVLSLLNVLIHSRDGYTAVVPMGLVLSGLVSVLLLSIWARGWSLTYRYRSGAPA
jgi:uncharacterized membrane protein